MYKNESKISSVQALLYYTLDAEPDSAHDQELESWFWAATQLDLEGSAYSNAMYCYGLKTDNHLSQPIPKQKSVNASLSNRGRRLSIVYVHGINT